MNEAETRAEHIDPALAAAGWGAAEGSRSLREYPIRMAAHKHVFVGGLLAMCHSGRGAEVGVWNQILTHVPGQGGWKRSKQS